MDGRTVQRLRLAEQAAAALQTENTYLSGRLLELAAQHDAAQKALRQEKLLAAAMIRLFGGADQQLAIPIALVDQLRAEMSTLPGLAIHLEKNVDGGYWSVTLRKNPEQARMLRACPGCGHDHVDNLVTRDPTDEEKAAGVMWVALCPVRNAEVRVVATDDQKRAIDAAEGETPPPKGIIEIVR